MNSILELSNKAVTLLLSKQLTLGIGESCTGGMLSQYLTAVAGCSQVFRGSVVAYANDSKVRLLGIDQELITKHGAVSAEVALAMAVGAKRAFGSNIGLGITGIAGPDGGTDEKPVGTVWTSIVGSGIERTVRLHLPGNRDAVRKGVVAHVLAEMISMI